MPDEHSLALRQADQLRTDIANVEISLEMVMAQLARCRHGRSCGASVWWGCWAAQRSRSLWLSRSGV